MSKLKIGVLLSGSGTNLQAIIDAIRNEDLPIEIVHVASSRPDAYGIQRATEAGIQVTILNRAMYESPEVADAIIVGAMQRAGAEYLVMAGYMRKVTHVILQAFPNRVINLHPALLPSFKGAHAIQDAWDAGVKVTGVTVHFANEEYDKGPIIAQEPLSIDETMTLDELEAAIHAIEHKLYPRVLRLLAEGRISLDGKNHVRIS